MFCVISVFQNVYVHGNYTFGLAGIGSSAFYFDVFQNFTETFACGRAMTGYKNVEEFLVSGICSGFHAYWFRPHLAAAFHVGDDISEPVESKRDIGILAGVCAKCHYDFLW